MIKEFICKGCGEKFNKDMQSSNVGYCYICNEFYMQKQISDLEANIAESKSKLRESNRLLAKADLDYKGLKENYDKQENLLRHKLAENSKLTLQLAEKDTEVKLLNSMISTLPEHDKELEEIHDQDKISFSVEQIVKTKETLIKFLQDEGFYENEWYDLFDKIDNQIEELKKEMK